MHMVWVLASGAPRAVCRIGNLRAPASPGAPKREATDGCGPGQGVASLQGRLTLCEVQKHTYECLTDSSVITQSGRLSLVSPLLRCHSLVPLAALWCFSLPFSDQFAAMVCSKTVMGDNSRVCGFEAGTQPQGCAEK